MARVRINAPAGVVVSVGSIWPSKRRTWPLYAPAGTETVIRRPPGRVSVRLVPARASAVLIASVARMSGPLHGAEALATGEEAACRTASWNARAKAEIVGKRSSGFLASARSSTASIAPEIRGLKLLGAGGGVLKC